MHTVIRWWMAFALVLPLLASAQAPDAYHIKLLAVQETATGMEGSDADLFLELREGFGRVFLETSPLTKLDTQISTRFAKETACDHFELHCEKYDFIFTIKSNSNIIGGPSAGAAIAALTAIAVLDLEHAEDIAVTGTVNSGGIIGHVGGLKEKLDAAAEKGIRRVLIPQGTSLRYQNATFTPSRYGTDILGTEVIEVLDLDDVLFYLTGHDFNHDTATVSEDKAYTTIMRQLQQSICQRTEKLERELAARKISLSANQTTEIEQRKETAGLATAQQDYYSAASFCFGTNIQLKTMYYQSKKITWNDALPLIRSLEMKVSLLEDDLATRAIQTISDLQAMMVVQERLQDTQTQISALYANQSLSSEEIASLVAYAEERFFSALSWTEFFAMEGTEFVLDRDHLQASCLRKISESEERFQYVQLFLDQRHLAHISEKITAAREAFDGGKHELCLITASQAKADAHALIGSLGLTEETIPSFFQGKKEAVERIIAENSEEGIFPIVGYSYYTYAKSLFEDDPFTALVYLEYALEMSDMAFYFPEKDTLRGLQNTFHLSQKWTYALIGAVIGIAIGAILSTLSFQRNVHLSKKRR